MSNRAKGRPPRGAELQDPSLWDGISVMDTIERAIERARRFPMHGAFVAELTIAPDVPISWRRTLTTEGHFTLHGTPEALLGCVSRVISIESAEGTQL